MGVLALVLLVYLNIVANLSKVGFDNDKVKQIHNKLQGLDQFDPQLIRIVQEEFLIHKGADLNTQVQ